MRTLAVTRKLVMLTAIVAFTLTGSVVHADILSFELGSHPDGSAADDNDTNTWYGVRLDDPATSDTETFRFNEFSADPSVLGASTVSAFLDTHTGVMQIIGTIFHIQDGGSRYGLNATIQLNPGQLDAATIADLQNNLINGTLEGSTTSLSLTDLDGGGFSPLEWVGHEKHPGDGFDVLFANNHRGNSGLNGWGWLEPADQQIERTSSQDWLFTMEYDPSIPPPPAVPEPATVALLGIGLAGILARTRKSNL